MSSIEPSLAGPKRPQDRVLLSEVDDGSMPTSHCIWPKHDDAGMPVDGADFDFGDGDVVIAAITSCTNTSNPSVLVAAGLVARKARERGSPQAVGQDLPRSGKPGRDRLSQRKRLKRRSERARLRPGRLRLHDLHRQFGAAAGANLQRDQRKAIWSRSPCSRATAISKAACRPTAAPTISRRRRWSSPSRSRARCAPTWSTSRSARAGTASRCSSRTSGRPTTRSALWSTPTSIPTCSASAMPTSITATTAGARSR